MRTMCRESVLGILLWSSLAATTFASEIICEEAGRFQVSDDQNGYVDCVPDDTGGVSVYRHVDCGDYSYSSSLYNCDIKSLSFDEYFEIADVYLERNESYDYACLNPPTPNICFSCNRKVQCIESEAYVEFCEEGETCAEDVNFGGGVCVPYEYALTVTSNCDCSRFGFAADGFNERCYLFCDPSIQPPDIEFYECPENQVYENGKCEEGGIIFGCYLPAPPTPNCTEMGTFINPNECSYYYACIPQGNDFEQRVYCCEDPTTLFNVNTGACENACDLLVGTDGPPFKCPGVGTFMDPYKCDIYYDCFFEGEDPYEQHSCPDGTYYHNDIHNCAAGTPEDCLEPAVDYSTCPRIDEVIAIAGCPPSTTASPFALIRNSLL